MRWTPERADALEQMWLWGIQSGTIAHNLGDATRNAVMGRINRTGMMGRGGEKIGRVTGGATLDVAGLRETVAELLREDYDGRKPMHWHTMVAVACLLMGRSEAEVARALGVNATSVAYSLDALHASGVWRKGDPPPAAWWHHDEGWMAFILDMMAAGGMIAIATTDADGGRSYERPDKNTRDPQ